MAFAAWPSSTVAAAGCTRNGHEFKHWPALCAAIARSLHGRSGVLDGEIVCLDADGRSNFYSLLFRHREPFFYAFDALELDGVDVRGRDRHELFESRRTTVERRMPSAKPVLVLR
jgi:ATP-dependent DNA ligase